MFLLRMRPEGFFKKLINDPLPKKVEDPCPIVTIRGGGREMSENKIA